MTVAIPLRHQLDYTELKYCLRSVDKYLPPVEVVLIGNSIPWWITGVTQIVLPDSNRSRNASVRRKILAVMEYVKDDIFYMNDDFYLLRPADPAKFPYYTSGVIDHLGESGALQLAKELSELGKPTRYFGHYPCIIKTDFRYLMENIHMDSINKSGYCNCIEPPTVEVSDCKINVQMRPAEVRAFIQNRSSFSTGERSLKSCLPILEELFPEKSRFEV